MAFASSTLVRSFKRLLSAFDPLRRFSCLTYHSHVSRWRPALNLSRRCVLVGPLLA